MYPPKYLKCLVKVINPPFILIISVFLLMLYSSSLRMFLCFSIFLGRTRVELVGYASGKFSVLKKPGSGKNMNLVLRDFFVPM